MLTSAIAMPCSASAGSALSSSSSNFQAGCSSSTQEFATYSCLSKVGDGVHKNKENSVRSELPRDLPSKTEATTPRKLLQRASGRLCAAATVMEHLMDGLRLPSGLNGLENTSLSVLAVEELPEGKNKAISFIRMRDQLCATRRERLQIVALGMLLFTVVINLLVFQPLTLKIMRQRHKIEKSEGIGAEVGWSKNMEIAKSNPELAKINKTHGFSLLANLFCFGGLAFHSWYIASFMVL